MSALLVSKKLSSIYLLQLSLFARTLSNNQGQKNTCCHARLRLFPQTKGGVSVEVCHRIQCAEINTKSIFWCSIWWSFRNQNRWRSPRRRAFLYNTLIEHVLYLVIHFLSKGKWFTVLRFSYRSRVFGNNLVFSHICTSEFIASFPMEYVPILYQNWFQNRPFLWIYVH